MKNKLKIFEVSAFCQGNYSSWIENSEQVNTLEEADLVLFKGGSDVDPSFYNEEKHPLTSSNVNRDVYEKSIYKECIRLNKKMLGVCRGAQFLSAMNGAKLHQHINNHGGSHPCHLIKDGEVIKDSNFIITSSHHQYLDLESTENIEHFELLGWWYDRLLIVPEFYKFKNCLCIQSHPEYVCDSLTIVSGYEPYIIYCKTILNNLINE